VTLLLILAGDLPAKTRKGDKLLKEGQQAEAREEWDKALELYEQALLTDPSDAAYQIAVRRVRFQAGQMHVNRGRKLREAGRIQDALAEFMKAYAIDPSSAIAEQEIRRTRQMLEQKSDDSPDSKPMTPAEQARKEMERRLSNVMPLPQLKPLSPQITALKMNNQPVRILFETVGKLAGINVMFDPEYQAPSRNFSIDLVNVTLEEALDHIAVLTKSFWKPLSSNTIFVTQDNPTKRRDYEDYVVKVFYLNNVVKPQDMQEILTAVRTLTDIRRIFPVNSLNAILVRGTADQVLLAEKLINDIDKPRSEVVVDVIVMEANRVKTRDLAATLANGNTAGVSIPIVFSPRNSVTTGSSGSGDDGGSGATNAVRLGNIVNLNGNDWVTTLPGAFLQALMSDRQTRILQSPQVRAVDGEKAVLRIGDRYPYATGSFQPAAVGTVSPLVSTQFQFAEVGVNVDLTPRVHGDNELTLHVELEISSVRDTIDVGGLSQPVIGQRKLTLDVRLKDGEASLLGGLTQNQDTKTIAGVPGLGNIPVLRRLFSSEGVERNQGELLIALVPHIVRSPEITSLNIRGVAAGSEQQLKLTYGPREQQPEKKPATEPKPARPAKPVPPAPTPSAEPKPAGGTSVRFNPPAAEVRLGTPLQVSLQIENVTDIFSAQTRLRFDPKMLKITDMRVGPFLSGDGQRVTFSESTLNDTGEAAIGLNRYPGSGGISGSGTLVTFTLQPQAAGTTQITVTELTLRNAQLQPITAAAPSMTVTIK